MRNILIAGGSGLVGQRLTNLLMQKGYNVAWLSRSKRTDHAIPVYTWDVPLKSIDQGAFEFADAIVNLAGAGIADKRWTEKYKQELYSSRIDSTHLISRYLAAQDHHVSVLVNASAIGIYGDNFTKTATEDVPAANTFLGRLCKDWESSTRDAEASGTRTVLIRTGIVLSEDKGFIGELKTPIKVFAGTALGSGKQVVSWIHIDDLCNIYIAALENQQMNGAYNAVAPNPATNKQLTSLLATQLHRPLILPNAAAFVLKMVLGEMTGTLVGSQPVSAQKIMETGFRFRFVQASDAVKDLVN